MKDCIFCKIIRGEIPCNKVYEDRDFLAFLDVRPLNPGHTLVVPKKHYLWVINVPRFGEYWETAGRVAKAVQKTLKTDSINFIVLGYEVLHAHIHIIPRFNDDDLGMTINWSKRKKIGKQEMEKIADGLRRILRK